jgi:endonuclease III
MYLSDIHVNRVFQRLGLIAEDQGSDILIYKARELHPEYPGIFDLSYWEIGRNWCRPNNPNCSECLMKDVCPSNPEKYFSK